MSTENTVSISIDPSPLRTFIKSIVQEELQPTLYDNDRILETVRKHTETREFAKIMLNKFHNGFTDFIRENISYTDLAAEISTNDIANEISCSDIADEIPCREIARHINIHDLAEALTDLYPTLEADVSAKIDYKRLAIALLDVITERSKSTTA